MMDLEQTRSKFAEVLDNQCIAVMKSLSERGHSFERASNTVLGSLQGVFALQLHARLIVLDIDNDVAVERHLKTFSNAVKKSIEQFRKAR